MVRTEFKFTMPPIMKGSYIIGTAVSEGEIEDFKVLTWLYQVMNITVVNHGANSAVIDVFPQIEVLSAEIDGMCKERRKNPLPAFGYIR